MLPDWAKSHQNDKKSLNWQKFASVVKNCQSNKKSPKWIKVLKLGSKGFQGVPDGSRSQTAWAGTTRGTYAQAPYAFAALGKLLRSRWLICHIVGFCNLIVLKDMV